MKYTEQIITLNKRKIGKWVLSDQSRIKQLKDEIKFLSKKTCSIALRNKSTFLQFERFSNKMVKKQLKIYTIQQNYVLYLSVTDQNYEFF